MNVDNLSFFKMNYQKLLFMHQNVYEMLVMRLIYKLAQKIKCTSLWII